MSTEMEGKSATELLGLGSKAYWTRKYADAAAYLSRSSEMLVEEHKDDKHNSLGNVYLYYGKTLLELAREDGDPLGDAVPKEVGVEDEGSDDSGDTTEGEGDAETKEGDDKEESGDTDVESDVDAKKKEGENNEEKSENKQAEEKKDNKTDDDKAADISINGEAATSSGEPNNEEVVEEAADSEEGEAEVKEEEEPNDLQLAWEVLELAKFIFEARAASGREDYADCLVTLGEVSLESENFDSAIADISSGLAIQKELYTESKDMRKLAETYYKLGMALSAHNKIDEGISNYQTTLEILKERLKVLEAKEEPGHSDRNEIKDIKNLMPELEDKIVDLKTYKEEVNKPEEEAPMVSSPEKKANNITHLVKRKRKLEEIAGDAAASAAKKAAP